MKTTVLVFGSEIVKEDSLALKVADILKEDKSLLRSIKVVKYSRLDDILERKNERIVILDVAKGIEDVALLNDFHTIRKKDISTIHDFNLGYYLKLMEAIGEVKNIKIIAIPYHASNKIEEIAKKVKMLLNKI